jgi:hypothetical protein
MTAVFQPELLNVGIVLAPCTAVHTAIRQQLESVLRGMPVKMEFGPVDWSTFFENGGNFYHGRLFQIALFPHQEKYTIYVCNLADGWITLYAKLVRAAAVDAFFSVQ